MGKQQIFSVLLYYFNYLLDRYSNHYRLEIPLSDSNFLGWAATQSCMIYWVDSLQGDPGGVKRCEREKLILANRRGNFTDVIGFF